MPILEELNPTLTAVSLIVAIVLTIIGYFQTVIDAQRKELSVTNERLMKLELEIGYKKELNDLRKEINELNRNLSGLQKRPDG